MNYERMREVIHRAKNEKWALGEFNMSNLEVLQAIVAASNELHSPVIVGISMGTLKHVGLNYLHGLIPAAKTEAQVPLFFHLDHGADFETIQQVIGIGFDSVMLDTSRLALEQNVKAVRRTVEFSHGRNVAVEAQVGEAGDEEKGMCLTLWRAPELICWLFRSEANLAGWRANPPLTWRSSDPLLPFLRCHACCTAPRASRMILSARRSAWEQPRSTSMLI
jgi:fructose/tagatose bisphosphate aldolase